MFKNTTSYKIVTILEKMNITNSKLRKLIYLIQSMLKYNIYALSTDMTLKSTNKPIEFFKELFKEYFYIYKIIKDHNIESYSNFIYHMVNNNIIGEIHYDNIGIFIDFNIITDDICIYIDTSKLRKGTKGFNLTEKNLEIFEISDTVYDLLNLFMEDVCLMMSKLIVCYLRKETKNV